MNGSYAHGAGAHRTSKNEQGLRLSKLCSASFAKMPITNERYWRWLHPGWSAKYQHDNTVRLSFRAAERGPSSPKRSTDAGSSPRAVDFWNLQNWMVRAVGIEPTLLSELDFESSASTNSTTPAWRLPIAQPSCRATAKARVLAHVATLAAFFLVITGLGRALRTFTAEASILFFKCRP